MFGLRGSELRRSYCGAVWMISLGNDKAIPETGTRRGRKGRGVARRAMLESSDRFSREQVVLEPYAKA
jgi:hypothetical protein